MPTRPEQHRLILNVAAAQHELETVAILMESIGRVASEARRDDRAELRYAWSSGYTMGDIWGYDGDKHRMRNPYEEDCA